MSTNVVDYMIMCVFWINVNFKKKHRNILLNI